MYNKKYFTPFLMMLLVSTNIFSNVYDNRFFPLYKRPYTKKEDMYSRAGGSFFAMAGDCAQGEHDEEILIPGIFGCYNQEKIGYGLTLQGKPNPLRDELKSVNLPWDIDQKINAQGFSFVYDQHIWEYFYAGASLFFMRAHSNFSFFFDKPESGLKVSESELSDLRDSMWKMHKLIGITSHNFNEIGFGDMDLYLRVGNIWDYFYRIRRIDAGISLGFLLPTGKQRCLNIPSSLSFGGNGHFGMYGQLDAEFQVKEDMKLLLMFRASKRFSKTKQRRVPIAGEHPLFGTLIAPVSVDPGITLVFSPQFWWENLRQGFGLRLGYTLVYHRCDEWTDCRSAEAKTDIPANLSAIRGNSAWESDYINASAYYDFYDDTQERDFAPIVSITWDWPSFILRGKKAPKIHRISLGVDVIF